VLTAKRRRLLKQAIPVVMLVMQVMDETNHAATSFRRASRLLVSIYGIAANEQNGPPMNANKRRWNENCAYRRSSAFIGGQVPAFRIQLKACKQMVNTSRPVSRT